jgi:hypothetical protein
LCREGVYAGAIVNMLLLKRSLRTLDALERSARDEHLHLLSLFGSAGPSTDTWLLEGLRLERAHMAKLVRLARFANRQFKLLERRVRAKVRRRSRTLWRLVRKHVLLRRVAWYWFELPSRSTCFQAQRGEAIEAFQRECATRVCTDSQTTKSRASIKLSLT